MGNVADKKSRGQAKRHPWWLILDLIAGLSASPTDKYLLTLIHRHTNARSGFAWLSQKNLAREMNVGVSTVERGFRWGKKLGIIEVFSVRTGPKTQHNKYRLVTEGLQQLQCAPEIRDRYQTDDPASMKGHNPNTSAA